jgi:hypothetical protein
LWWLKLVVVVILVAIAAAATALEAGVVMAAVFSATVQEVLGLVVVVVMRITMKSAKKDNKPTSGIATFKRLPMIEQREQTLRTVGCWDPRMGCLQQEQQQPRPRG